VASTAMAGASSARPRASYKLSVRELQPSLASASAGAQTILVRGRTRSGAQCGALVSVKRVRQHLSRLKADRHGRVGWRWVILSTSPSGTWRITLNCRLGHRTGTAVRAVLIVTSSSNSKGSIGDPNTLTTADGTTAGNGAGVCGPFPPGQCTCLAYQKRQDVYDTAVNVKHVVPAGGTRPPGAGWYVWDGGQWLVNAQRAGIPTGSHPVAGALVVWGVPNSASAGHVAYVEQATSDTHVLISECNYDWHGSCRTIWENPQAAANLQGYIYGGPAGNPGGGTTGGGTTGGGTTGGGTTGGGPANLGQGMAAGTSPAIAGLAGGGYEMAFQANTGELIRFGTAGNENEHQGMAAGTSPAIAGLAGGGYEMAFQANTGELIVFGTAGNINTHQGMMHGTSPSIAASTSGRYQVTFQANNGNLYTYIG
jgi:hypothetical protein